MAKQTILVGTTPNDGTGDLLRNAMIKCNSNFTELYDDMRIAQLALDNDSEYFTLEYGSTDNITSENGSVFQYQGAPVTVNMTVSPTDDKKLARLVLSAPLVEADSVEGPIILQRVTFEGNDVTVTNIFGKMIRPETNEIFILYDDDHNLPEGTEIQYRLYNSTGSGQSGGDVTFDTSLGFQFSVEEI